MESLTNINFGIWALIKILTLCSLGVYIIFAFVITRQVKIMTSTLTLGFEFVVRLLALTHLAFAIFVFITALTVL